MAIAVLLIVSVLLQQKGAGLGSIFGGGGEGNVYRTKRGLEKKIFIATIVLSILFVGIAFINLLIH